MTVRVKAQVRRAMTRNGKNFIDRWAVGLSPARPVARKRHRLAPVAEHRARGRRLAITARPSRSDRLAGATDLPFNPGASLIVIVLLSLGLWAAIWGAVASLASAVLG
jgi:hypothetical protein